VGDDDENRFLQSSRGPNDKGVRHLGPRLERRLRTPLEPQSVFFLDIYIILCI
jgi:hypothetical protein